LKIEIVKSGTKGVSSTSWWFSRCWTI